MHIRRHHAHAHGDGCRDPQIGGARDCAHQSILRETEGPETYEFFFPHAHVGNVQEEASEPLTMRDDMFYRGDVEMSPELSLDERMMAAVDKLEDTSPNVRTAAVNALENLGGHLSDAQDQTLVMALNAKLASTEPYVRFAAMRAMSVLDPGVLVDHAYVFGDILARGRFVPMELLGAAMRAKEVVTNHAAVERFVPMLRSVNAEERRQAVTDLGDLGLRLSKRQAQAVVALLGDPKWWVQAAAVKTLAKLPQPHLYAKDVVPMLTARENGVRDAAVAMLKNLPPAELEEHEENLKAMASNTAEHVRDAAGDVLRAHGIEPPLPSSLSTPTEIRHAPTATASSPHTHHAPGRPRGSAPPPSPVQFHPPPPER